MSDAAATDHMWTGRFGTLLLSAALAAWTRLVEVARRSDPADLPADSAPLHATVLGRQQRVSLVTGGDFVTNHFDVVLQYLRQFRGYCDESLTPFINFLALCRDRDGGHLWSVPF